MKISVIFALLIFLGGFNCMAQDTIVLRDSTILNVTVLESNDKSVIFTYPNETVRNEKLKKQIAYIIYTSGRKEICEDAISIPIIESEKEWQKVIVTSNREDVESLKLIKSLSVSAGNGGIFDSAAKAHDKAIEKLKKKAAKLKCGIVLITFENIGGKYNNISTITGEAYSN